MVKTFVDRETARINRELPATKDLKIKGAHDRTLRKTARLVRSELRRRKAEKHMRFFEELLNKTAWHDERQLEDFWNSYGEALWYKLLRRSKERYPRAKHMVYAAINGDPNGDQTPEMRYTDTLGEDRLEALQQLMATPDVAFFPESANELLELAERFPNIFWYIWTGHGVGSECHVPHMINDLIKPTLNKPYERPWKVFRAIMRSFWQTHEGSGDLDVPDEETCKLLGIEDYATDEEDASTEAESGEDSDNDGVVLVESKAMGT